MKKILGKRLALFTFFSSFLIMCTVGREKEITGHWKMHQVIMSGADVTEEHDPYHERHLILNEDLSFESGGRPWGKNSGTYTYQAADGSLFLDSDVGPEDDSAWKVHFNGDTMFWQGVGTEWAEDFQLIQIRAE